jgi:hypothetical protein
MADCPRVHVWPGPAGFGGFAAAFRERVVVPEPPGQPSRWALVLGTADAGQGPIHVGLALHTETPAAARSLELRDGDWAEVLGLRDVPADEQIA